MTARSVSIWRCVIDGGIEPPGGPRRRQPTEYCRQQPPRLPGATQPDSNSPTDRPSRSESTRPAPRASRHLRLSFRGISPLSALEPVIRSASSPSWHGDSPVLRSGCDKLLASSIEPVPPTWRPCWPTPSPSSSAYRHQSVAVVWPGPESGVATSPLTAVTVVGLIGEARKKIPVSYAAHAEQLIGAALGAASARGVSITLLAESHADNRPTVPRERRSRSWTRSACTGLRLTVRMGRRRTPRSSSWRTHIVLGGKRERHRACNGGQPRMWHLDLWWPATSPYPRPHLCASDNPGFSGLFDRSVLSFLNPCRRAVACHGLYVRLVRFLFLILIGRFVTLDP